MATTATATPSETELRAALLDEARRILDLLTEARGRWLLLDEAGQAYFTTGHGSDRCDLGQDLTSAAAHARHALRSLEAEQPSETELRALSGDR